MVVQHEAIERESALLAYYYSEVQSQDSNVNKLESAYDQHRALKSYPNDQANLVHNCSFCGRTDKRKQCPDFVKFCGACGRKRYFKAVHYRLNKEKNKSIQGQHVKKLMSIRKS